MREKPVPKVKEENNTHGGESQHILIDAVRGKEEEVSRYPSLTARGEGKKKKAPTSCKVSSAKEGKAGRR